MADSSATAAADAAKPAAPPAAVATQPLQGGVVRSCPSGDTIVVRPRGVATLGAERTIHIAGIAAPRMGSRDRDDEPFAFPSREHLRKLLVGREVRYRVEYTVPLPAGAASATSSNGAAGATISREYCHVFLPPETQGGPDTNVSHKILRAGWARVHDSAAARRSGGNMTVEEEEEGGWKAIQRTVQDEAQKAAAGIWGPDDLLKVEHNLTDAPTFLYEWKGKEIESVVEQVRDGSMLRVRLLLTPRHHQLVNLSLAGIKAPRIVTAGANSNDQSEPFAEESRFFVESRLLQRNVRVTLLALPQATAPTPFSLQATSSTAAEAPTTGFASSVIIGQVMHPVGDIAQFLLSAGLAKCVDWHAGMLANSVGGMEKYRLAEKAAKEKRLNVWRDYRPAAKSADALATVSPQLRNYEAIVVRVISGDTIHVRRSDADIEDVNAVEQRIHLSSIRQPMVKDEKQAGYAAEGRELLRKRLVGKPVQIRVDYIKKEPNADDRTFATVTATTGAKESRDVGETLLQRGLATVTRHRAGDEDRSPDWDKLMAVEAEASTAQRGIHSGKELAAPKYVDASESAQKANAFLATLKRNAKGVHATVDFCASASRFKLIVPREQCRLTFVLAGIRAPRTARNASEKDEPYSRQGLQWSTAKVLQRDVDVEFLSTDKGGGFVGSMTINNKSENVAVGLVERGLASVHYYSAESLSFGQQLIDAEREAKKARRGIWTNHVEQEDEEHDEAAYGQNGYDAPAAQGNGPLAVPAATGGNAAPWASASSAAAGPAKRNGWGTTAAASQAGAKARTEYIDIMVSDIRGDGGATVPFGLSVQILNDRTSELERLMQDLSVAQRAPTIAMIHQPRIGDWVAAKYSADGQWYRGQVLRNKAAKQAREIVFVDYGNVEDVPYGVIRPLDEVKFGKRRLAAQASPARLSFVKVYEGRGVSAAPSSQQDSGAAAEPDEYALDALDRLRDLTEGRKLIANVDLREPNGTLHLTLYDPSEAAQAISQGRPEACINVDLCREGHATPDRRVPYWNAYPAMTKAVLEAHESARRLHSGMFELGDPTGDD